MMAELAVMVILIITTGLLIGFIRTKFRPPKN